MGANVDNLIGMARTKSTPELEQEAAQRNLRVLLGLEQPTQTSAPATQEIPTAAEQSAQMSLATTKPGERQTTATTPAPGYTSRYRAVNYNMDENGIITNIQFSREDDKMGDHLDRLVKRGKMSREQADSLRDSYDLLQANGYAGLKPNVELNQDDEGNWNNIVNFPERPDIAPFVIQGTKTPVKPPTVTAAEVDERYRKIIVSEMQGDPISLEDQAWAKAYEKQKNVSRQGYIEAYVKARLQLPTAVWDVKNNRATIISNQNALNNPDRYEPMSGPRAKAAMPNSTVVTMQQTAPHVLDLISSSEADLKAAGEIGPIKSRWRDLWAGKVGTADPTFTRLRVDTNLMMTLLMKMHVGARGSEYILKHFQEMIDAGKQSPENLQAAFGAIRDYANQIMQPGYGYQGAPFPAGDLPIAPEGTMVELPDGSTITSDGKGGWY